MSVFGSSIRDDFKEDSDVDFLVSFRKRAKISLFDIIDLKDELLELLDREVDVVEKEGLRYPVRRRNILSTREIIYAV